jgi:hypothetical protein
MSTRDVVKVGRVSASGRSSAPAADLFLDKESGLFFGQHAARNNLAGIDLSMQWAYEHPWGVAGSVARRSVP